MRNLDQLFNELESLTEHLKKATVAQVEAEFKLGEAKYSLMEKRSEVLPKIKGASDKIREAEFFRNTKEEELEVLQAEKELNSTEINVSYIKMRIKNTQLAIQALVNQQHQFEAI